MLRAKPEPDLFLECARRLEAQADQCYVIAKQFRTCWRQGGHACRAFGDPLAAPTLALGETAGDKRDRDRGVRHGGYVLKHAHRPVLVIPAKALPAAPEGDRSETVAMASLAPATARARRATR